MSIQAVAWALDQDLPARPKLVLVSIANHANHTDGYCWLKVDTIGQEASCSPRGVYNFVGDLIRNGYIRKSLRRGDDGKQRATDYWILFDRAPAKWISAGKPDEEPEPEIEPEPSAGEDIGDAAPEIPEQIQDVACDINAPTARDADGEMAFGSVNLPARADGPSAPACRHKDSEEPSKTNLKSSGLVKSPPRGYRPPPTTPQPLGSTTLGGSGELIFVFKPSKAYDAWAHVKERERRAQGDYRRFDLETWRHGRCGWYFPTLFPPEPKPPPTAGTLMTADDAEQFCKTG